MRQVVRPKKWSRSFTGGGRLLEIPTVRLLLGKFWCFWLTVACRRWSLTRDGRTWRFDCIWFYFLTNKIFVYDNHCSHSLKKPFVIALILDSDIKFKNICSQEKTKLLGNVDLAFFFSRSCSNVGITAVVVLAGVDGTFQFCQLWFGLGDLQLHVKVLVSKPLKFQERFCRRCGCYGMV